MAHQPMDMIHITWRPDKQAKASIYSQIVAYFQERITSGDWVSGQKLPSQRKLAEMFGVNRSTIVEAMDELTALGLLEGSHGGGTRVANEGWAMLIQDKTPDWQSYIKASRFYPNVPTVQIVNRLEFQSGITRMSTGELSPELMQTKITQDILSQLSDRKLFMNYPDPLGMPSLRRAIQAHLKKNGIEVPISSILVVSGALQALQLISIGIVKSQARVFVESPSYLGSLNIFQSVGAQLVSVPMDAQGIAPWRTKDMQSGGTHSLLYTIPTFQNPTGCVMPASRRREVLQYCTERHIPIIEDDVFRDLWLDAPPPPPMKAIDRCGSVVYISSLSKCFSPGFRLGWLVGPEAIVQRLADAKMQMDYGVSVLTQQVAEELFTSGLYEQGVQNIRERLRLRRDFMMELLEKWFTGLADWNCPAGGFFVWIRLRNRVPAENLFKRALSEGLLIMPGGVYDKGHTSSIRLTYGYLPKDEMARGVRRLSEMLRSLQDE